MTFGDPGGATGGWNGAQSGCESRMSTLTTPLNGSVIRKSNPSIAGTRAASRRSSPCTTLQGFGGPGHRPVRMTAPECVSEDGFPVVTDADQGPAAHVGALQCLLG